jgi:hypothetical protein
MTEPLSSYHHLKPTPGRPGAGLDETVRRPCDEDVRAHRVIRHDSERQPIIHHPLWRPFRDSS